MNESKAKTFVFVLVVAMASFLAGTFIVPVGNSCQEDTAVAQPQMSPAFSWETSGACTGVILPGSYLRDAPNNDAAFLMINGETFRYEEETPVTVYQGTAFGDWFLVSGPSGPAWAFSGHFKDYTQPYECLKANRLLYD